MFPFQPSESSPEPSESPAPKVSGISDEGDRRAFHCHKLGPQIFIGCLAFVLGALIALIPWMNPPFDGRGWEFSVPLGAICWVIGAPIYLYWGTTVIDREAQTVTFRWGWLVWTFGGWSAPLEDFQEVTFTKQKQVQLLQFGQLPLGWTTTNYYRVLLTGSARASQLFKSFAYEETRVRAREIANWLGLRVVNQIPEEDRARWTAKGRSPR